VLKQIEGSRAAVGAHIGKRAYIPVGDYDYCKGCGICVAECPCGAIEMQPEPT